MLLVRPSTWHLHHDKHVYITDKPLRHKRKPRKLKRHECEDKDILQQQYQKISKDIKKQVNNSTLGWLLKAQRMCRPHSARRGKSRGQKRADNDYAEYRQFATCDWTASMRFVHPTLYS